MSHAKSEFLTTVSHELRTPLTSILAFADVLKRNKHGNLVDRQERQLGIIQRSGRRLAVLIDDLLDATHIEQSKFEPEPTRFDIGELVTELSESFAPILSEKNQTLVVDVRNDSIDMFADQIRMSQVLSNLITNASKYSNENTQIKAVVELENEDEVVIRIEDQGIGIDREDLTHVFGAFFRSDNEGTRMQSGTGIGLYFCRMIVEYHSGEITAESDDGQGTVITLRLPREFASIEIEDSLAA